VPLFERQKRIITITAAGKRYHKFIQKALTEIDKGTQDLISSHNTGELTLSVTPAFLNHWYSFYDANPDIDLHINATTTLIDFPRSETDIAVHFGLNDWVDVEAHFLRHSERVPVCSPKLLKKGGITTAKDMLQHKLLYVSKRSDEWPAWFAKAECAYKPQKRPISFSSGSLAVNGAIKGVGITLADISLASDSIKNGELVMPIDLRLPLKKAFYLVYEKNRKLTFAMITFAMKVFKEWIMTSMSEENL